MTKVAVKAEAEPELTTAIRTVSESDDVHVIEGLAFPFKGRDTYGTFFSTRTDFHWDLFPDSETDPAFIRPVTIHHGFDPDFGLSRIGGWTPVRTDADGVWVQAQLDKRQKYYATRIKPLLDEGALGLSGGSAEHSVRFDERSGEVLEWPAYELALTPVESNPLAQIAVRAGEVVTILTEDAQRRDISTEERNAASDADFAGPDRSFPILQPEDVAAAAHSLGRAKGDTASIKAKIIAIAKRKGAAFVAQLPDAWKEPEGGRSGTRAGRTISAETAGMLQPAHDAIASLLGMDCAAPGDNEQDDAQRSDEPSPDAQPAPAVREDVPSLEDLVPDLAARAAEVALGIVRQRTG